jgi:hypothetical protein
MLVKRGILAIEIGYNLDGGQCYRLTAKLREPQGRPEDLRLRSATAHPIRQYILMLVVQASLKVN